jgi:uncharacterized protein YggU (UPF0235/DUF167 family)
MYLKIRVLVDAKQEKVEEIRADDIKIWVKQKAENNQANKRILEILQERYPNVSIRIVSGHHSPSKIVSIG